MPSAMSEPPAPLRPLQVAFVNRYLNDPKPLSLLVMPPGYGKTAVALEIARRLSARADTDATMIVTPVRALQEHWRLRAIDQLGERAEVLLRTKSYASDSTFDTLDDATRRRRLFLIVDVDPADSTINAAVEAVLRDNPASRALFLASASQAAVHFDSEYHFDREIILGSRLIGRPETQLHIQRFSPSVALLEKLHKHRADVDNLSWRDFERLVALMLEQDGWEVKLQQGSKDGGIDIIAEKDSGGAGRFQTLWQAKKKKPGNKVGLSVIREMADVRQQYGASKAILVTTTYLTRGASARIERDKYLLGKVDRHNLEGWIARALFDDQKHKTRILRR